MKGYGLRGLWLRAKGVFTESIASSTVFRTSKSKYSNSSFPDSTRVRSRISFMTLKRESAEVYRFRV